MPHSNEDFRVRGKHKSHYWWRFGAVGITVLAFAYCAALATVFILGQNLPDEPSRSNSPAVVVVFYDDLPLVRQGRVRAAAARIAQGAASHLIAVGGWRPERRYNGASLMATEALAMGVAPESLRHDAQSNDSVSNLRSAAALSQDFGDATLELVSDRYHLVRLKLLATWTIPGRDIKLVPAAIDLGPAETLRRLHHELLAYASLLLPRWFVEFYLSRTRMAAAYSAPHSGLACRSLPI